MHDLLVRQDRVLLHNKIIIATTCLRGIMAHYHSTFLQACQEIGSLMIY